MLVKIILENYINQFLYRKAKWNAYQNTSTAETMYFLISFV